MALNAGLGFNLSASDNASFVFGKVGKSLGILQKNAQDTGLEFDKMTGRVRDATTGRFAKQTGIMSPQWLEGLKDSMGQLGQMATNMGNQIFGALGQASQSANDFATSAAKVATIADAAEFPLSKIRDIGFEMGQAYGGDLNTQLDALYSAIGSGASTAADGIALMNAANKLAIGGLTTVDISMNGLMGTLNAYGMEYSRATEVTDAFFQSVMLGGSDMAVSTLANGLGNITPLASAMNVSLDEMLGGLARLTAMGQKTDIAITNLKGAMEVMLKPNADAVKEAKRLGIQFDQNSLKSKGFLGTIKDITSATNYNAESMTKLFGQSTTGLGAMLALGGDGGEQFGKFMEDMADKTGKTEFAFKTLAETSNFASSVLKATLQTTLVKVGDIIAPILGNAAFLVNKMLGAFNSAPPVLQKVIVGFTIMAGAGALLTGALIGVGLAMAAAYVVGTPLLFALGGVALVMGLVTAAAIPLLAVSAAIYVAWNKNIGGFASKVSFYFGKVKLLFDALSQAFSNGSFSGAVLKEFQSAENAGIKRFAIQVFLWGSRIKNFVKGIGTGFAAGLEIIRPTIDLLVGTFKRLAARFAPVGDSADQARAKFQGFGAMGMKVGVWIAKAVEVVAGAFNTALSYIDGFVAGFQFMQQGSGGLGDAFGQLLGAFTPILDAFGIGSSSATGFGDVARVLGAVIGGVLGFAIRGVVITMGIFNTVLSLAGGIIGSVVSFVNMLYKSVYFLGKMLIQVFSGDFKGALQSSKEMTASMVNGMLDMFASLVLGIAGAADSIASIFGKKLGAKDLVAGYVTALKGAASDTLGVQVGAANTDPSKSPAAVAQSQQLQAAALTQKDILQPGGGTNVPPIQANINTKVQVDGQTLAESNDKAKLDANNRGFGPTTSPT